MGPLHCPLCIGLALLSMLRTAAHGVRLVQAAGFIPPADEPLPMAPIPGPLLAP